MFEQTGSKMLTWGDFGCQIFGILKITGKRKFHNIFFWKNTKFLPPLGWLLFLAHNFYGNLNFQYIKELTREKRSMHLIYVLLESMLTRRLCPVFAGAFGNYLESTYYGVERSWNYCSCLPCIYTGTQNQCIKKKDCLEFFSYKWEMIRWLGSFKKFQVVETKGEELFLHFQLVHFNLWTRGQTKSDTMILKHWLCTWLVYPGEEPFVVIVLLSKHFLILTPELGFLCERCFFARTRQKLLKTITYKLYIELSFQYFNSEFHETLLIIDEWMFLHFWLIKIL